MLITRDKMPPAQLDNCKTHEVILILTFRRQEGQPPALEALAEAKKTCF